MPVSKRIRQLARTSEDDLTAATSAFIESLLTPTTSIPQTTDNHGNSLHHKQSSQENSSIDLQHRTIQLKRKSLQNHLKIESKTITMTTNKSEDSNITQNNNEDNWECPVAVALRRAGYDVPLRPSKSWLQRDRKKQALLRQQRT